MDARTIETQRGRHRLISLVQRQPQFSSREDLVKMRYQIKLLLGIGVAASVLSAAVTGASARRFEVSNQGFLAKWAAANKLAFVGAFEANILCKATFEGSFHSRTISKVCGQLIGYITNAKITHPCENGEGWTQNGVEVLPNGEKPNTLPWPLLYMGFRGTLPRITGIRVSIISAGILLLGPFNTGCLYRTSLTFPLLAILEINEVTGSANVLRIEEAQSIPVFTTLAGLCVGMRMSGAGEVFLQNEPELNTTRVTVRLVQ
jgi:hypothetical protein